MQRASVEFCCRLIYPHVVVHSKVSIDYYSSSSVFDYVENLWWVKNCWRYFFTFFSSCMVISLNCLFFLISHIFCGCIAPVDFLWNKNSKWCKSFVLSFQEATDPSCRELLGTLFHQLCESHICYIAICEV